MVRFAIERYRAAYSGLPREVWMLAFVLFVNRCGTMVLPFLTLFLTSQVDMSEAAAGRMISVYGLGSIGGAYLGGRLTDSFGAIRLQTLCLFLSVPCLMVVPMWSSWLPIAGSLFVWGLVSEAVRPANAASVTRFTTSLNRTRAFALQRLASNLGFSFGPAVGGLLATIQFKLLFVADAFTTFVAALAILFFFRMRRVENRDTDDQKVRPQVGPLRDGVFVCFLLLMLASLIIFCQFLSTYPLYLRDHFQLTKPMIGLIFAVNTSVIVLFEMLLIDSVRHWAILPTIGWGCFLSCIGFGILPFGSSGAFCVFAMIVLTFGEMLSFPLSSGFVANRSPPGGEGFYMGWFMVMHSVAWVLGPAIGSFLYEIDRDALWIAGLFVGVLVLVGFQLLSYWSGARSAK